MDHTEGLLIWWGHHSIEIENKATVRTTKSLHAFALFHGQTSLLISWPIVTQLIMNCAWRPFVAKYSTLENSLKYWENRSFLTGNCAFFCSRTSVAKIQCFTLFYSVPCSKSRNTQWRELVEYCTEICVRDRDTPWRELVEYWTEICVRNRNTPWREHVEYCTEICVRDRNTPWRELVEYCTEICVRDSFILDLGTCVANPTNASLHYTTLHYTTTNVITTPYCYTIPACSLSRVGMLRFIFDINQPSLSAPFFSAVIVSVSVFMALSTVLRPINSPDNSLLSYSVRLVLFLPYWSFQLYVALWKSPSALI